MWLSCFFIPFLIVYYPDKHETQRMCNEAVNDSLDAWKLIPDWFVTSKVLEKLYAALNADWNILYFNEDSGDAVFSCNEMGILSIDLNYIYLDNSFDEDDPDTVILVRLLAWYI